MRCSKTNRASKSAGFAEPPGGKAEVELRNVGDTYTVHDCVLAFPVPSVASEILDFAGRWGKERVPQRRPINLGTHLREGRKGPGRTPRPCCTSAFRASRSPTARYGPFTPGGAATTLTTRNGCRPASR